MNCNIRFQLHKHQTRFRVIKTYDVPCLGLLRTLCAVLLLLVGSGGMNSVWAQSEGVYYIDNNASHNQAIANRYYLIPADDSQDSPKKRDAFYSSDYSTQNGDPTKPFLTTYMTNKDAAAVPAGVVNNLPNNSVWIWKAVSGESGFFNIIHAASGKYVVYEPPLSAATNRKSMHLLATNSPGENAKFEITVQGGDIISAPKALRVVIGSLTRLETTPITIMLMEVIQVVQLITLVLLVYIATPEVIPFGTLSPRSSLLPQSVMTQTRACSRSVTTRFPQASTSSIPLTAAILPSAGLA